MLLNKIIILLTLSIFSVSSFSEENWSIIKKDEKYLLKNPSGELFHIEQNGIAKLETFYKKDKYNIIEYYAGEAGTSTILKIHNRIVFDSLGKTMILTAPYKYSDEPKKDQPVWKFDFEKKPVKIIDRLSWSW